MARVFNINTDKFTLLQEIERLKYCLSQYETLLNVKPFDKDLLKGDKGDKGDKGKALYYTDLTPEQITELQRPAADMIAELTTLQEELDRVEALRQQAEELRVLQNQEALSNANTARNLAIEVITHPPVIVNDVWHRWNFEINSYETTGNKAKGDSAYQLWLDAGNTGTVEDFLEDINGDTGNSGVFIGEEEPTDPDVNVWIDIDDEDVITIESMVNTTYSNLLNLRNNNQLIPGTQYRITDYSTTTSQPDTLSAGHDFDIIVVADSTNKLNENARAVQRVSDTYFNSSKMEAWQLKYSLDNDTTRFAWADTVNGKGVIYKIIDENNNECSYDFKNIMFKRPLTNGYYDRDSGVDTWVYTFTWVDENIDIQDLSIVGQTLTDYEGKLTGIYGNKIKSCSAYSYIDSESMYALNDNVFISNYSYDSGYYYGCYLNTFGNNCYSNTFGYECSMNTFGNNCYSNTFVNNCYSNTFGNRCYSNTFENRCYSNTFGDECHSNTFDNYCYSNTFGYCCQSNTFGKYGYSNTFGNRCSGNTLGYSSYLNTFGDGCSMNTFGDYYTSNTLGINCSSNTFGINCYSNTFENQCSSNTFGDNCYSNTFGSDCPSNTFGYECSYNTFGINCSYNTLGNQCSYNTFGANIWFNLIGDSLRNVIAKNGLWGLNDSNKKNWTTVTAIYNKDYPIEVFGYRESTDVATTNTYRYFNATGTEIKGTF